MSKYLKLNSLNSIAMPNYILNNVYKLHQVHDKIWKSCTFNLNAILPEFLKVLMGVKINIIISKIMQTSVEWPVSTILFNNIRIILNNSNFYHIYFYISI